MLDRKEFEEKTKKLTAGLSEELDEKRFRHTMSVAQTAACMAMRHGYDPYEAYLAGLLHDCAKCMPHDKKLALCAKYGISISHAEKHSPDLLHAKLGSKLANVKYGITDAQILSAIEYHTTGKPEMTLLEQIIYIADYIEIHRKPLPNMEKARQLAFCDLDACMLVILESTLDFLKQKDALVDEITLKTYEYYKKAYNKCD